MQWLLEDGVGAGENDDEDNIGELFSNCDWCNSLYQCHVGKFGDLVMSEAEGHFTPELEGP